MEEVKFKLKGPAPCGCGDRFNGTSYGRYPCPSKPSGPILLLFPHIPKTGGTSIMNYFKLNARLRTRMTPQQFKNSQENKWECAFQFCTGYGEEFAGPGPHMFKRWLQQIIANPREILRHPFVFAEAHPNGFELVSGRMWDISSLFPAVKASYETMGGKFLIFSMFREPASHFISSFYFFPLHHKGIDNHLGWLYGENARTEYFWEQSACDTKGNNGWKRYADAVQSIDNQTLSRGVSTRESSYENLKDIGELEFKHCSSQLANIDIVGRTDRYQESLLLLLNSIGIQDNICEPLNSHAIRANSAAGLYPGKSGKAPKLYGEDLSEFKKRNRFSYMMWEIVEKKWEQQMSDGVDIQLKQQLNDILSVYNKYREAKYNEFLREQERKNVNDANDDDNIRGRRDDIFTISSSSRGIDIPNSGNEEMIRANEEMIKASEL